MYNCIFKKILQAGLVEMKKIDNFIQEIQLKINKYNDIVLEWIPYN